MAPALPHSRVSPRPRGPRNGPRTPPLSRVASPSTGSPRLLSCFLHSSFSARAFEARDGLDVRRVGEHVHGLHPLQAIAAADELAQVPCQRRRIARNVDDARGCHLQERAQRLRVEARARRVRNDDLGADTLGDERRKHETNLTGEEGAVGDAVGSGVAGGVVHRGLRHLDAIHPAAAPGQLRLMAPVPEYRSSAVSSPVRPAESSTRAKSRSACAVLVWKKELAETWNRSPPTDSRMWSRPPRRCSSTPTATLAFLGLTFITTLVVRGTRAASRAARGASSDTAGEDVTILTMLSPVRDPSRSMRKRRSPSPESCSHAPSPLSARKHRASSSSAFMRSDWSRQRSTSRTES